MPTNQDYREKLNLVYEIEGLLHLLIDRGDQAPAEINDLLRQKVSLLATGAEGEAQAQAEGFERRVMADEPEPAQAAAHSAPRFTINDTYRFKRELFRNSNEEWQEALDVIAAMGTFDEVEDYFYNDQAWDPESDDVKAFMDVVRGAFD